MDVTSQLLKLFNVEKQIRGLKGRLTAAERFLAEQDKQLAALDAKKAGIEAQAKTVLVASKTAEGEAARFDARMTTIKTQMDSAQTNKEYKAFLTEHNTLKVEKDKFETQLLEAMGKVDEFKKQIGEVEVLRAEREKVRGVALADRDARAKEIQGRLDELAKEREVARGGVPADVLSTFDKLLQTRGEDAMAHIEELDRRHYEFTCGSCQRTLTMDAVNGLLSTGKLTRCTNCGCVLYVEKELAISLQPAAKK